MTISETTATHPGADDGADDGDGVLAALASAVADYLRDAASVDPTPAVGDRSGPAVAVDNAADEAADTAAAGAAAADHDAVDTADYDDEIPHDPGAHLDPCRACSGTTICAACHGAGMLDGERCRCDGTGSCPICWPSRPAVVDRPLMPPMISPQEAALFHLGRPFAAQLITGDGIFPKVALISARALRDVRFFLDAANRVGAATQYLCKPFESLPAGNCRTPSKITEEDFRTHPEAMADVANGLPLTIMNNGAAVAGLLPAAYLTTEDQALNMWLGLANRKG